MSDTTTGRKSSSERARGGSRRTNQRSDVLDAALTLFAEQGYRSTGVRDIAEALGIGPTSVYSHIRSKAELLRDIVVEFLDLALAAQADAIASSSDVETQLRRIAEAQVRLFTKYPREATVTTQDFTLAEGDDLVAVQDRRRRYLEATEEVLTSGVEQGRFSVENVKITAFAIIEMCEAVPKWFHHGGGLSEERVAYLYGELAVRMARG